MVIVREVTEKKQRKPNAPVVGTPENRSGATSVRSFFLVLDFVGVAPDLGNHTSPQILPCCSLIRCQLRTARRGRASFFPELVRFLAFPPFRLFILPESGA